MKIIDESKNLHYEGNDTYATIIASKDGIRFVSDAKNSAELTSICASFLAGTLKCMIDSGLTRDEVIKALHSIINKINDTYDQIDKATEIIDDK